MQDGRAASSDDSKGPALDGRRAQNHQATAKKKDTYEQVLKGGSYTATAIQSLRRC